MEGNLELFVTSMVLLATPFVACGALWLVARLVAGMGRSGGTGRTVPPSTTTGGRVVPGTRTDDAD